MRHRKDLPVFECQPETRLGPFDVRDLRQAITDQIDYHGDRAGQIANDQVGDPGPSYAEAHEWERHRDTLDALFKEWEACYDPE